MKLSSLKPNPDNPRLIKDKRFEDLKTSIKDFPKGMKYNKIIIDENNVILSGNMRYRALLALDYEEIPDEWVIKADDLEGDEREQLIIKPNLGFGEWDYNKVANEWDAEKLGRWGMEIPSFEYTKPEEEWVGMPDFENQDLTPIRQIIVSFKSLEDIKEFSKLVNQNITDKTKSIWYPKAEIESEVDKAYIDEPQS